MSSSMYRCLRCWYPSASLYHRLNSTASSSDIQLCLCSQCGAIVDPYCERDDILVALDCFLLRTAAYRHVLCNRLPLKQQLCNEASKRHGTAASSSVTPTWWTLCQTASFGALLRAHIAMIATPHHVTTVEQTVEAAGQFGIFFIAFWLAWVAQVCVVDAMVSIVAHGCPRNESGSHCRLLSWWALWIPLVGIDVATALIHLWENTPLIRELGWALILVHQGLTVSVVIDLGTTNTSKPSARSRRQAIAFAAISFVILLVSVGVRVMVVHSAWRGLTSLDDTTSRVAMQCPGIQITPVSNGMLHTLLGPLLSMFDSKNGICLS